jgi:hypothetical protein
MSQMSTGLSDSEFGALVVSPKKAGLAYKIMDDISKIG